MPATVGRVFLLLPIVMALAKRVGFEHDSNGYNGLCLAMIVATYQCGTTILPANAPNMVLAGSAETLYGLHISYGEYLRYQFPVLGALGTVLIVGADERRSALRSADASRRPGGARRGAGSRWRRTRRTARGRRGT